MNYQKIYNDFITDRLTKQDFNGYGEKHHIVPKSMGGSDDDSNIIKLTAGDHYFAHLCLAKWHGGKQWSGVWAMAKLHVSNNRATRIVAITKRWAVDTARAETAKARSIAYTGRKYRDRMQQYTIFNIDGRTLTGAQSDLAEKTGTTASSIYNLVNRKQGMTYSGWYFDIALKNKTIETKRNSTTMHKKGDTPYNARSIICVETGVVYISSEDAAQDVGSHGANIRKVLRGERKKAGGLSWKYAV